MNVLYIADPTSIHDVRWINALTSYENVSGFVIWRSAHSSQSSLNSRLLNECVCMIDSIEDPSVIRPWRNWIQLLKVRKIIRRHNIRLLHILYAEPNALWSGWKSWLGVPVLITTRGTDILKTIPAFFANKSLLNTVVSRRYRRAFNDADQIFCTSLRQIERLKQLSITASVKLVRTGIDIDRIKNISDAETKNRIRMPYILMPRNMRPIYNHEFSLDAIGLLDVEIRKNYRFVFVGSNAKDQSYFRRVYDKAHKIDAEILFLPSLGHAELLALLKGSCIVVMNPLSDGSPVTAMEAMAFKVPVILPPLNYDEDVFGGVWSFNDWSPASLATSIKELVKTDRSDLSERLEDNFRRVAVFGNTQVEMHKVVEVYSELNE